MPDLLLEIGCEELPPSAVASGEAQLRTEAERLFDEARIARSSVEVFATPRRLALLVREVPERQEPTVSERRGPPVARAFGPDGSPTPAASGFAEANEVRAEELVRRETPQGEYVFAVREVPGGPSRDALPGLLSALIASLSFPKTMRWDDSGVRFPRPIRWLVALWDAEVLPVRHGSLVAGRHSFGHRVFHPGPVELEEAGGYAAALQRARVVAARGDRRDSISAAALQAAARLDGRPVLHDAVLEEVTDLVEDPAAFVGRFDERYLELPREVLVTAMESHQRYFGIEDTDGNLLPGFVVVSNSDPQNEDTIASGNERVLRARLEDAVFFFREDLKVSLSARAEALGGMVFHARLGTLEDKLRRVTHLGGEIAAWLGLDPEESEVVRAAAGVYKADLLSHVVYEFPELEGIMGREYALRDEKLGSEAGELLPRVASAIYEHRLPRFPADELPVRPAGVALGLADRLDTLVGYLGIGLAPTGSEDPYALRRTAAGFALISLEREARVPLAAAVAVAHGAYSEQGAELEDLQGCLGSVRALLLGRVQASLERDGIPRMLVDSAVGGPWSDLPEVTARAGALLTLHGEGGLHPLAVAHERAYNLSRQAEGDVDPGAFVHEAERLLYAHVVEAEAATGGLVGQRAFADALRSLAPVAEAVEVFFDRDRGVLVMDPEERLRRNRLALLGRTAGVFGTVADFSVLIPAELEKLSERAGI